MINESSINLDATGKDIIETCTTKGNFHIEVEKIEKYEFDQIEDVNFPPTRNEVNKNTHKASEMSRRESKVVVEEDIDFKIPLARSRRPTIKTINIRKLSEEVATKDNREISASFLSGEKSKQMNINVNQIKFYSDFRQRKFFKNIKEIKLYRMKEEIDGKITYSHKVYIQGKIVIVGSSEKEEEEDTLRIHMGDLNNKEYKPDILINLSNFDKTIHSYYTRIKNCEIKKKEKEKAVLSTLEFFSKLFNMISIITNQFNLFLKNVNLQSLIIFALHKNILLYDFNRMNFQEHSLDHIAFLIKRLDLVTLIDAIPDYINYIVESFFQPIFKEFNTEFFIEKLFIDKSFLRYLKKYDIFTDVSNITNKYFNFFFLKWRMETVEENMINPERNLVEDYFYIYLKKIEHYYKNFFPYCCGNDDDDDINYVKSPFVFCLDCNSLICDRCIKYHKNHKFFDFANFRKNKESNIFSEKEKHKKPMEKDFPEDLIMMLILTKMRGRLKTFLVNTKKNENENYLKNKMFLTFFDFMDITLMEYFVKMVIPFMCDEDNFTYMKTSLAKDANFKKSLSNALLKLHGKNKKQNEIMNLNYLEENIKVDFSQLDLNDYYITVINEMMDANIQKENESKYNRYLIEELYLNKLSTELGVGKALLTSNTEMNYDVHTNSLDLFISQPNSPKQFYRKFLNFKSYDLKNDKKAPEKSFEKDVRQYKTLVDNFANAISYNKAPFSTSSKYNIQIKKKSTSKIIKNPLIIFGKPVTSVQFDSKALKKLNKLKTIRDDFDISDFIEKAIESEMDHKSFDNLFYIDPNHQMNGSIIRTKYKEGYAPKLEFIINYMDDWLTKVNSYGIVKFN